MSIFEIFRARRAMLKITQQELADITGISPRTLVDLEQGKGNPSLATLQKVASVLGLEITAVIKKTV